MQPASVNTFKILQFEDGFLWVRSAMSGPGLFAWMKVQKKRFILYLQPFLNQNYWLICFHIIFFCIVLYSEKLNEHKRLLQM